MAKCITSHIKQIIQGMASPIDCGPKHQTKYFFSFSLFSLHTNLGSAVAIHLSDCTLLFEMLQDILPGVQQPLHRAMEIVSFLCHTFQPLQISQLLQGLRRYWISVLGQINPDFTFSHQNNSVDSSDYTDQTSLEYNSTQTGHVNTKRQI